MSIYAINDAGMIFRYRLPAKLMTAVICVGDYKNESNPQSSTTLKQGITYRMVRIDCVANQ